MIYEVKTNIMKKIKRTIKINDYLFDITFIKDLIEKEEDSYSFNRDFRESIFIKKNELMI